MPNHDETQPQLTPPNSDPDATLARPGDGVPGEIRIPGYDLQPEIAQGGMGVVYAARDLAFGREVAIKVMLPGMDAAAFVREARITGRLPHPGIPPVYALGELPDGRPFLAMKLIRGDTLDTVLKRRTDFVTDRGKLLAAFEQMCHAVGYAHAQGIIHRDLKPSNVMVGAFGEVQVMDWGLAKEVAPRSVGRRPHVSSETAVDVHGTDAPRSQNAPHADTATVAGQIKGTPAYMAPEQARGEAVDARADVFALGGILAAILTGKPPFAGNSVLDTIIRAAQAELGETLARLHESGADAELLALCKKCLAPKAEDRYSDATELALAVAAYRAEVEARLKRAETEQATAAAKAEEQRKRRKVMRWGGAVLALVLLAGTGISLWQANVARGKANALAISERQTKEKAEALELSEGETKKKAEALNLETIKLKLANERQRAARVQSANLFVQRGLLFCEQGDIRQGRLWLAQALAIAPPDEEEIQRSVRLSLANLEPRAVSVGGKALADQDGFNGDAVFGKGGVLLLMAGQDDKVGGKARLWELAKDCPIGPEVADIDWYGTRSLSVSPCGRYLAARHKGTGARVWESESGKTVAASLEATFFTFNGDASELLTPTGPISIKTGRFVSNVEPAIKGVLYCCRYSPDEKSFVHGGFLHRGKNERGVAFARVYDSRTCKPVSPELTCGEGLVASVAFSADGKYLATGTNYNTGRGGEARIWETKSWTPVTPTLQHSEPVTAVAFSPDGSLLASGTYLAEVRFWEVESGRQLGTSQKLNGNLCDLVFEPTGKSVLAATRNGPPQRVRVHRVVVAGKQEETVGGDRLARHRGPVRALGWSADGKQLWTGGTTNCSPTGTG